MKPLTLRFTPKAAVDFEIAAGWWRTNRPAAPRLFEQEVAAGLELLASAPAAGAACSDPRLPGVRRCYLRATRYWIYYRAREQASALDVLRIWHSSRGRSPPL